MYRYINVHLGLCIYMYIRNSLVPSSYKRGSGDFHVISWLSWLSTYWLSVSQSEDWLAVWGWGLGTTLWRYTLGVMTRGSVCLNKRCCVYQGVLVSGSRDLRRTWLHCTLCRAVLATAYQSCSSSAVATLTSWFLSELLCCVLLSITSDAEGCLKTDSAASVL